MFRGHFQSQLPLAATAGHYAAPSYAFHYFSYCRQPDWLMLARYSWLMPGFRHCRLAASITPRHYCFAITIAAQPAAIFAIVFIGFSDIFATAAMPLIFRRLNIFTYYFRWLPLIAGF
jgi:hypothetical protein